jgi:hypothetical protein
MPARIGSFTGGTFPYGQPLSIVQPPDNDFSTAKYFPDVLAEPGLTPAERDELQRQYEELLAALSLGRDFYSSATD